MNEGYHNSRFSYDPRRDILWRSLWRFYFSALINPQHTVLDIGCGYGNFINNVVAKRRIALDTWPGCSAYIDAGVELMIGDLSRLAELEDYSIDFAFASNVFEHISIPDLTVGLSELRRKLKRTGTLTIIQPNFRYAYREYFDDYTHLSIFSHISLTDFLRSIHYDVFDVRPRFLPLTVKSRLPVSPILIAAYLAFPFKPLAKQMLVRARPAE